RTAVPCATILLRNAIRQNSPRQSPHGWATRILHKSITPATMMSTAIILMIKLLSHGTTPDYISRHRTPLRSYSAGEPRRQPAGSAAGLSRFFAVAECDPTFY